VGSAYTLKTSPQHDPNAMVVDALRLSPVERAEHMRKNQALSVTRLVAVPATTKKTDKVRTPHLPLAPIALPKYRLSKQQHLPRLPP
jgi:hypothetical protein